MLRIRLLFIILSCLALSSCASLRQPEKPGVAVTSLEMGESSGLSQSFLIGLSISNPNNSPLRIQGMSYTLALNGFELLEGVKGDIPVLEPYSETQIELLARTNIVNAFKFINSYMKGEPSGEVTYRLQAKLDVGGWLGQLQVVEEGEIATLTGFRD